MEADGETWLDTERGIDIPPERRRCGYVFQDYALFPHLSAWQNVAYPLRGISRRERRARAQELLERFGLGDHAEARPDTLSGGERQRVALARMLARSPGVLLLDEPLSALDARTRASAARELAAVLNDVRVPALLVTHDFAEAAQLGDRVGVIDAGRIVQEGTPTELAAAPRSAFVADFTGAVVLSGTARSGHDGLTLVDLDGGGEIASTDEGRGRVAASVFPWEIAIEPVADERHGSAQNRVLAEVLTVTAVGNRVRLGLAGQRGSRSLRLALAWTSPSTKPACLVLLRESVAHMASNDIRLRRMRAEPKSIAVRTLSQRHTQACRLLLKRMPRGQPSPRRPPFPITPWMMPWTTAAPGSTPPPCGTQV